MKTNANTLDYISARESIHNQPNFNCGEIAIIKSNRQD